MRDRAWSGNPVDRFIRAAQAAKGVTPYPEAPSGILLRRLYFDLVGLPPSPEDVQAFVKEAEAEKGAQRGTAYSKRVDALLASPQFGERWARHWLDLARYADSDGQESDADRPNAYHYRDFVVRAFNEDLPYDTFVRWQLAGDELEPKNPEAISATGFVVAGTYANLDSVPMEEEKIRSRLNERDDMISTTGQAFLGLTLGCARCHDHKYDPIPTRDYYRMQAAFNAGERANVTLPGDGAAKAFAMKDFGATPRPTFLLERGDLYLKKEPLELGFLSALMRDRSAAQYWYTAKAAGERKDTTYQRAAMAQWITDTEHGAGALLARVIVNRLWQHHFGEGLVRTPNDFGLRGEEPTHPELLEWLANDLVANGWKLKRLHRMMALSRAYRMSSTVPGSKLQVQVGAFRIPPSDPENRLLWRRRPRRIEAEAFRDSMLAVSGELDRRSYGPPYKAPVQREALQARNVKDPYPSNLKDTPETHRRTLYMFHKRVVQSPLLQAFDAPDASLSCGRRAVTTVAPQALAVLNESFVRARAAAFARRIVGEAGADPAAQVRSAFRLALSRLPSASEQAASLRFLEQAIERRRSRDGEEAATLALTDLAQTLFALNEFIYVD